MPWRAEDGWKFYKTPIKPQLFSTSVPMDETLSFAMMSRRACVLSLLLLQLANAEGSCSRPHEDCRSVPLYRLFETSIRNNATEVTDRFAGVWLNASFVAPSGKLTRF